MWVKPFLLNFKRKLSLIGALNWPELAPLTNKWRETNFGTCCSCRRHWWGAAQDWTAELELNNWDQLKRFRCDDRGCWCGKKGEQTTKICHPNQSSFCTEKEIQTWWLINYLITKMVIGKTEKYNSLPQHTNRILLGESSAYKPPNHNTTLAPED